MNSKTQAAWIRSDACTWPKTVKEQALLVLEANKKFRRRLRGLRRAAMMDPRKIKKMEGVAEAARELANTYVNLANELAVYRSIKP